MIMAKKPKTVGIYRLTMKTDSDNFRSSAIQGIIDRLKKRNVDILIYEPTINDNDFNGCKIVKNFNEFSEMCDIVLVNRIDNNTKLIANKIYTRDLYTRD